MTRSPRKLLFMAWGWLAIPWVLASLVVAFSVHWGFGLCLAALLGLWFLDMGETTCSRCNSYGTGRCGVQSWLVPLFWAKRTMRSASRFRVRLHFYFDLLMMVVGVAVFSFVPVALPFFVLWLAIGWVVVFGPKEHHGLLPLLRIVPEQDRRGRSCLLVPPSTVAAATAWEQAESHAPHEPPPGAAAGNSVVMEGGGTDRSFAACEYRGEG